jgi:hypothetical protein
MDDRRHPNSQDALDIKLGSEPAQIVDARPDAPASDDDPPSGRQIVTTCFHGDELNEGIAAAFRIMGIEAPLP